MYAACMKEPSDHLTFDHLQQNHPNAKQNNHRIDILPQQQQPAHLAGHNSLPIQRQQQPLPLAAFACPPHADALG